MIAARRYRRAASASAAIAKNGWMKSRIAPKEARGLSLLRSGPKTAKSIKAFKVSNAATANNTRRNQTPDAAETAVLAADGEPEEFSDTLASCEFFDGTLFAPALLAARAPRQATPPRRRA